ncbi:hypothetical protein BDW62DRAFT_75233 [Aspergillus aurantiobrunneus]
MSSLSHRAIDPPEHLEPTTPRNPVQDTHSVPNSFRDEKAASVESSLTESKLGTSPKASPTLRSRTGTLSWQQRPSSRDLSGNRSLFSTSPSRENRWRAMSNASTAETGVLRSPLTSLPASRESSSLRQTERDDIPTEKTPVEEPKAEPVGDTETKGPETEERTESGKKNDHQNGTDEQLLPPSRPSSSFADSSLSNRYSSVSSVSTATGLGSPLPLSSAQKFEPPKPDGGSDSQAASPTSPRRFSPERSTSPTKGLGGFVQSAMMRRSDSISKRWSAQLPSGLSRVNSVSNNRNSFAAPSNADVATTPKLSCEGPSISPHRPTSSHSEATTVRQAKYDERPETPPVSGRSESASRPPFALHTRSSSAMSVEPPVDSNSRPTTPVSRTMDPKRWSPTKSTWLESALNLSESPRHKRQPSQQASWSKDRQSRGSVDLGRRGSFKEVNPVGLMRTAPLGGHVKKQSLTGIPDVLKSQDSSPTKENSPNDSSSTKEEVSTDAQPPTDPKPLSTEANPPTKTKEVEIPPEVSETAEEGPEDTPKHKNVPPALSPTPKIVTDAPMPSPREPIRDPLLNRPKPQSPVIDFRANLRKREVVKDQSSGAEPEFKNVFGKLRKAETSNYVAPDELKNNILKGKAALNATGGPKKTQRVDEFKESILKQKEAMKANGGTVRRNTLEQDDTPAQAVPEALLKRRHMAMSSIDKNNLPADNIPSPTKENDAREHPHTRQSSLDSVSEKVNTPTPQATEKAADARKSNLNDPSIEYSTRSIFNSESKDEIERPHTSQPSADSLNDKQATVTPQSAGNAAGLRQPNLNDPSIEDPISHQSSTEPKNEVERHVENDLAGVDSKKGQEKPIAEAIKPAE